MRLSAVWEPVDAASLAAFRVTFGVLMFVELSRYFLHGWIDAHYLQPEFLFKFYGFEWVAPWPGNGLYWHFAILLLLAAMVALGVLYRFTIAGLFLGFAYVFFLDQAQYLNHYYLLLSLAFILIFLPADREYSLRLTGQSPPPRVPRWSLWALRLQFEIVLLFAGLVKVNEDWLAGQPLGIWLSQQAAVLPTGAVWFSNPGQAVVAAYAVLGLHLIGAPLLLWRRTRLAVFCIYTPFHLASSILFQIGIFPWITLAGTLLFFEPDWPRSIAARIGFCVRPQASSETLPMSRTSILVVIPVTLFFVFQLVFPLRSLFYPGKVSWTHQGYDFSWRMKLDDKRSTARFLVSDPKSGRRWEVNPKDHLGMRQVITTTNNPDMIIQFAHYLERLWMRREGLAQVEVRAQVMSSLNGRVPALLIDPELDLTRVTRSWKHYDWILPLQSEPQLGKPAPHHWIGDANR